MDEEQQEAAQPISMAAHLTGGQPEAAGAEPARQSGAPGAALRASPPEQVTAVAAAPSASEAVTAIEPEAASPTPAVESTAAGSSSAAEPQPRRLRRVGRWLLLLSAAILTPVGTVALGAHLRQAPDFFLEAIRVEGCDRLAPSFIRALSGVQPGVNLVALDSSSVSRKIEACPLIEGAAVIKQFPRSLLIRVSERRPVALVHVRGSFYCLDGTGVVCSRPRADRLPDLPILTGLEAYPWAFGRREVGRRVQDALTLLQELNRRPALGPLSEIHVDAEKGLSFYLESFPVEVRVGWDPFDASLARLQRVLPYLQTGSDRILSVDVRFARRVFVKEGDKREARVSQRAIGRPSGKSAGSTAGPALPLTGSRDAAAVSRTGPDPRSPANSRGAMRGWGAPAPGSHQAEVAGAEAPQLRVAPRATPAVTGAPRDGRAQAFPAARASGDRPGHTVFADLSRVP